MHTDRFVAARSRSPMGIAPSDKPRQVVGDGSAGSWTVSMTPGTGLWRISRGRYPKRRGRGETPRLEEYSELFPLLARDLVGLFKPAEHDPEKTTGPSDDETTAYISRADAVQKSPRLERLGEFRILGMIGRGGMGVVYRAQQESLGRKVASQGVAFEHLISSEQVVRFKREAQAAARLHHTNIVPVYGVGEDQGVHFYVMQYIEGQGLDAIISELRKSRARRGLIREQSDETEKNGSDETGRLARYIETGRLAESDSVPDTQAAPPLVGWWRRAASCSIGKSVDDQGARGDDEGPER